MNSNTSTGALKRLRESVLDMLISRSANGTRNDESALWNIAGEQLAPHGPIWLSQIGPCGE